MAVSPRSMRTARLWSSTRTLGDASPRSRFETLGTRIRGLNHDGSLLLVSSRPVVVYDVTKSPAKKIAELGGQTGDSGGTASAIRQTVYGTDVDTVYGTEAETLRIWDARSGTELAAYPNVGQGQPSISADGTSVLISGSHLTGYDATLLETAARGEVGSVATCSGFVNAASLQVSGRLAAFLMSCGGDESGQPTAYVIDLTTMEPISTTPDVGTIR